MTGGMRTLRRIPDRCAREEGWLYPLIRPGLKGRYEEGGMDMGSAVRMRSVLLLAAGAAALAVIWFGAAALAVGRSVEGGYPVRLAGTGDEPMPYHGDTSESRAPSPGLGNAAGSGTSAGIRIAAPGESGEDSPGDIPDTQAKAAGRFRGYLLVSAVFLVIYCLGFWFIQVRRHMPGRRE
ncbi:hypothetical protein SCFA_950003 [anaerobic digester metagenome]|uniref:Uncharacterized protein n=1 Tax=anaerobic digester metagenome TaxID=1263854 RepID=A0A485M7K3_9ZZZZ